MTLLVWAKDFSFTTLESFFKVDNFPQLLKPVSILATWQMFLKSQNQCINSLKLCSWFIGAKTSLKNTTKTNMETNSKKILKISNFINNWNLSSFQKFLQFWSIWFSIWKKCHFRQLLIVFWTLWCHKSKLSHQKINKYGHLYLKVFQDKF